MLAPVAQVLAKGFGQDARRRPEGWWLRAFTGDIPKPGEPAFHYL